MKQVCIIGTGRLAEILAAELTNGKIRNCRLKAVYGRTPEHTASFAKKYDCIACSSLKAVNRDFNCEIAVEAANADAVKELLPQIIESGMDMICISTGAFHDQAFYQKAESLAQGAGRHVYLATGVVGGIDYIRAAALMSEIHIKMIYEKPVSSYAGGSKGLSELPDGYEAELGTAYETYPRHLNVTAAVNRAAQRPEHSLFQVRRLSDTADCYSAFGLEFDGEFGKASLKFSQGHKNGGRRGPQMAAYSALAKLQELSESISF